MPIVVSKTRRIASRVELVVVPLTVEEARATSLSFPPNIPLDDPRSPPFAGKKILKAYVSEETTELTRYFHAIQIWRTSMTLSSPLSLSLMSL